MKRGRTIMLFLSILLACAVGLFGCTMLEEETEEVNIAVMHDEAAEETDQPENVSAGSAGSDACEEYEWEVEPGVCSYIVDCNDADTCEAWSESAIRELEAWLGDLTYAEEWEIDEEESAKEAEAVAGYPVEGNALELTPADEEEAYYAWLWERFAWIIPADQRTMVSRFEVYDHADMMAYVVMDDDDYEQWVYAANLLQSNYETERVMTDVHEFGHLLSLNAEQVDPYADEEDCGTLFMDEGCAYEDAYIYRYYQQFWEDGASEDEDDYVNEYAMSDVYEDFAESWTYYVMTARPLGSTVRDRKVDFFYAYDELVMLKAHILGRAASWMDRNVEVEVE